MTTDKLREALKFYAYHLMMDKPEHYDINLVNDKGNRAIEALTHLDALEKELGGVWTPEMKAACMKDAASVCKLTDERDELRAAVRRLRDVVEWYGNECNYIFDLNKHAAWDTSAIDADQGQRARDAKGGAQ